MNSVYDILNLSIKSSDLSFGEWVLGSIVIWALLLAMFVIISKVVDFAINSIRHKIKSIMASSINAVMIERGMTDNLEDLFFLDIDDEVKYYK